MPGIKALRKIQHGVETTSGTAVAATSIWRGMGTIEDRREVKFSPEDVGHLLGLDRTYIPRYLAAISFDSTPATFEQLSYLFNAGIKHSAGVQDGSGSDYIYTHTFPLTSLNTLKTYTLEGGDNQEVEEMEYSFVEAFKLTGKAGECLMVQADWLGRQAIVSSFTGALSMPTVEDILFQKGKLYIDAVGGTLGATQKTQTLLGMELACKTGMVPVWTADGQLYFTFAKMRGQPELDLVLDITFEHDSVSAAEKVIWRAQTPRQIRLDFDGNALSQAGTTFSTKKLRIDMAGKWEKFDKIDEQDGNDIVKGRFRARYNATAALGAEIKVVNELSALP